MNPRYEAGEARIQQNEQIASDLRWSMAAGRLLYASSETERDQAAHDLAKYAREVKDEKKDSKP